MGRTIIVGIYFFIQIILTLILYFTYILIYLASRRFARRYLFFLTHYWSRHFLKIAGIKLEVSGLEELPRTNNLCLVSNHQSYLDIPVIIAAIPKLWGFVAKVELARIPVLNLWMLAMDCVLINRSSSSTALEKIQKRVKKAEKGKPMVLFPEGTRGKGPDLGKFKTGGLHIVLDSTLVVLPVSINGTYPLLEKDGRLKKGKVKIQVHPPLDKERRSGSNREITAKLRDTIQSGLI